MYFVFTKINLTHIFPLRRDDAVDFLFVYIETVLIWNSFSSIWNSIKLIMFIIII